MQLQSSPKPKAVFQFQNKKAKAVKKNY